MKRAKTARARLGFTLLEALIALVVLGIGSLGIAEMIAFMTRSNRSLGGETDALALADRLMAEIGDAYLVAGAPSSDPGLVFGQTFAPVAGSTIRTVGTFNYGGIAPNPPDPGVYQVFYEVEQCTVCGANGGIEALVVVRNVNDLVGPLIRPVQLMERREAASTSVQNPGAVGGTGSSGVRGY
jgi:prepilin-type N-terminal cleavage/methylation domain-containing protein